MSIVKVSNEAGKLQFQIIEGGGFCIAKSLRYRTICSLEDALRSLYEISLAPLDVVVKTKNGRYQISSKLTRQRLTMFEAISTDHFVSVLTEMPNAMVIDSRPLVRRRTDLGGPLKSLI